MIHYRAGERGEPLPAHLESGRYIDSAHPAVRRYAEQAARGADSAIAQAVRLFYAVRDGIRYDAFAVRLDPIEHTASHIAAGAPAYCVPKAVLLAAAARAVGIPSAIGLSNVRNHLTSPKLLERMGGNDLFVDHGYAVLHLEGRWVKAAPAFNIELCERFGVRPTEFDGRSDAVFQEFDRHDRRHMEYVTDHGMWSDLPYERVEADMRAAYPAEFFLPTAERF
jgi:transglutaminase-like putative cysteine protease